MDADDLRADTEYAFVSRWHSMPEVASYRVFAGLFPNAKSFAPNAGVLHEDLLSVLNPDLDADSAFTVHRDGWLMGPGDATSVIHYWKHGNWSVWDKENTWMGSPDPDDDVIACGDFMYAVVPKDAWSDDPVLRACEAALTSVEYANRLRDKWLSQAFKR